eukprot:12899102-Prorocentrum_lima.AAC.1
MASVMVKTSLGSSAIVKTQAMRKATFCPVPRMMPSWRRSSTRSVTASNQPTPTAPPALPS